MATAAVDPQTLWAPFDPRRDGPFDHRRARHLLRRAGFGAAPAEVETAVERGLADTVAFLLAVPRERDPLGAAFTAALAGRLAVDPVRGLQARWLRRMIETPYPLRERLTLLWHDHFATSLRKVRRAPLMARQIETLRHHALGPFGALVRAMATDPAMILWLDAQTLGARDRFAEALTSVHGPLTGPVRFDPLARLREADAETLLVRAILTLPEAHLG